METNYYDLLQVSPHADQSVIEAAYHGLAAKYQAAAATDPNAAGWLNALNQAYAVLSDPQRRAEYDRSLGIGATGAPAPVPPQPVRSEPRPVAVVSPPPAPAPASVRRGLPMWLLGLLGLCALLLIGTVCVGGLLLSNIGGAMSAFLNGGGSTTTVIITGTPTGAPTAVNTTVPTTAPATVTAPASAGFISKVTLATSTQGDNFEPVGVTTTFDPAATFHAVVTVVNAPANSNVRAVWFADNVGGGTAPNTKIDEYSLTTDGSRNLDFTLKPKTTWPNGTYHVDIYANGQLAKSVPFSVGGGSGSTPSSNSNSNSATGLVQSTTLARSVTPNVFDPVDPTTTFTPNDVTLHLVVAIKDAPDNTSYKVTWYYGTQVIDSTTLTAAGTRNLDFTLKQNRPWPTGNYHVEVAVNGTADQTVNFQVQ